MRIAPDCDWSEDIAVQNVQVESDISYFRRRASEERSAALQARPTEARLAHLELADRYEDLVRAIAGAERNLGIGTADDPLKQAVRRISDN